MGRPVSGNQSGQWIFCDITDTYVLDMRFRTDEDELTEASEVS